MAEATQLPLATERKTSILGLALYALAIFGLAVMDAGAKWLSSGYPTGEIVFFRALFGILPIFVVYFFEKQKNGFLPLTTKAPFWQILRGILVLITVATFFWALKGMALADATAIAMIGPILIVLFGALLLKEKVSAKRWICVFASLIGVLFITRPSSEAFSLYAIAAIVSIVAYAFVVIVSRHLAGKDSSIVTYLWTSAILGLGSLAMITVETWTIPGWMDLFVLALIGIMGGVSNIAALAAFQYAEVSLLAPIDYSIFVWAVPFGAILFGQVPTFLVFIGAGIVIASGVYIARNSN